MYQNEDSFSALAEQVRHGDQIARTRLRDQLEHEIIYIVRRTVRSQDDRTSLGRRILAQARRMGLELQKNSQQDDEKLIHRIAQEICQRIIARLRPDPRSDFRERDTLCDMTHSVIVLSG